MRLNSNRPLPYAEDLSAELLFSLTREIAFAAGVFTHHKMEAERDLSVALLALCREVLVAKAPGTKVMTYLRELNQMKVSGSLSSTNSQD
jgi:hypothetical protein